MDKSIDLHPCFSEPAKVKYGRIHLPVAPKCNVKCVFCTMKYDCANESRPGVTSAVLSPEKAAFYFREMRKANPWLTVAGIAGPGDAFANPEKTIKTLELIRCADKDVLFCVSTNGLEMTPYINELRILDVSHITVTVSAVNVRVGKKVYSWIKMNKKLLRGKEGAAYILERQEEAIRKAKEAGITIKVNSIILPGINDMHIPKIAEKVSEWGAKIQNCLPVIAVPGSENVNKIKEPGPSMIHSIREKSEKHILQMRHCGRCRADAIGLIGDKNKKEIIDYLHEIEKDEFNRIEKRKNIAVASREGLFVNMHLGETPFFRIYDNRSNPMEIRNAPPQGTGGKRWHSVSGLLTDCHTLLVSGVGSKPREILEKSGIEVHVVEGLIGNLIEYIESNTDLSVFKKRVKQSCSGGTGCTGSTAGCL